MRLRKLMHTLSLNLFSKRRAYKFEHERPSNYDIKMYLAKRRLERENPKDSQRDSQEV